MDLRALISFVTVCRLGNITRAAEALYISQPALTRQIQELEQELGCQLLVRSTRSLSLTENGYLFMLRAQEILDLAKQAKNELSENEISSTASSASASSKAKSWITLPMPWCSSIKNIRTFSSRFIRQTAMT